MALALTKRRYPTVLFSFALGQHYILGLTQHSMYDFTELFFTLVCAAWGVFLKGLFHIVPGSVVIVET